MHAVDDLQGPIFWLCFDMHGGTCGVLGVGGAQGLYVKKSSLARALFWCRRVGHGGEELFSKLAVEDAHRRNF
jgi:hypothetical protein